jgi:hypothetical protein
MFFLRTFTKKGLQLVGSAEIEAVDLRLGTLCRALSSSLELEHWKFEASIKEAISNGDDSFAHLCAAAQPLADLVLFHTAKAGAGHSTQHMDYAGCSWVMFIDDGVYCRSLSG